MLTLVDPRAAYPTREGDLEHLHQQRPVRSGLLDPHDPARGEGPARSRRSQPRLARGAPKLTEIDGVELVNASFFNEFTLRLPKEARPVVRRLAEEGVLGGVSLGRLYPGEPALANGLVVAVTETVTHEDIAALAKALREALA